MPHIDAHKSVLVAQKVTNGLAKPSKDWCPEKNKILNACYPNNLAYQLNFKDHID